MATKAQILQQLQSQNWILTDAQKEKFKRFLYDYTVEPSDLPYLRKIALANNIELDKFKDTALFEKIKTDVNTKIEDAVCVLDKEDKNELKKERFMRLKSQLPATITRDGIRIRVRNIEPFNKGISVYVQAWDAGTNEQYGFEDGTIDIQRIRIKNPQVLVEDFSGDIERVIVSKETDLISGEPEMSTVKRFKEDLQEALLQQLFRTVKRAPKQGADNIIVGKVGTTVTVVRPEAGTSVNDTDVEIWEQTVTTWTPLRSDTSANNTNATLQYLQARLRSHLASGDWLSIYRPIMGFDTTPIGTDTVTDVVLSLTGMGFGQDAFSQDAVFVNPSVPSGGGAYAAGDFAIANHTGGSEVASRLNITSTWDIGDGNANDITFNATGRSIINGSGVTFISVLMSGDFDNVEPTWGYNVSSYIRFYSADEVGTAYDPEMTITHSPAITSNVKGIASVLQANIKSIAGILKANIKSVAGVTN